MLRSPGRAFLQPPGPTDSLQQWNKALNTPSRIRLRPLQFPANEDLAHVLNVQPCLVTFSAGLMRRCRCCCHDPEKRSGPPPILPLSPCLPPPASQPTECTSANVLCHAVVFRALNAPATLTSLSQDNEKERERARHVPSSFLERKTMAKELTGRESSCIDVRGSRSLRLTRSARTPRRSFWNDRKRDLLSGSCGSFANPVLGEKRKLWESVGTAGLFIAHLSILIHTRKLQVIVIAIPQLVHQTLVTLPSLMRSVPMTEQFRLEEMEFLLNIDSVT